MFHTIRTALPRMRRRRWGRVVNIGMERSEEFTEPPFDYTVGKIARHGLTRILSEVEIGRGITINAVAPGYIPYFTFRQALDAVHHRGLWASRRNGTPQDIAEVVTFLCSDEARNPAHSRDLGVRHHDRASRGLDLLERAIDVFA